MHDALTATPSRNLMERLKRAGSGAGAAVVLLALVLVFALSSSNFLTVDNLVNIGLQSTILMLLALPMTLIILSEGLDLSMGAVLTLCNVVLALVAVKTGGLAFALAAALAVGLAFGLLNGTLVAALGIPPFVATLGTLGAAQGLALVVTDGQSVVGIPESLQQMSSGRWFAFVPAPIAIAVLAYVAIHLLLYKTRFGNYVFALGGNREALTLAGVKTRSYLVAVYALGG